MSHNFLFGGVKIGSNAAFHCFVLQRKLIYSIKYVVYEIRRSTVTVLEKRSSSYHKEVQRIACRQRTGKKSSSEREGVQIMSR